MRPWGARRTACNGATACRHRCSGMMHRPDHDAAARSNRACSSLGCSISVLRTAGRQRHERESDTQEQAGGTEQSRERGRSSWRISPKAVLGIGSRRVLPTPPQSPLRPEI
eukprot:1250637-Rhodomonas_salina.1